MLALEEKYEKDMEFIIADTNTQEGQALGQQFNIYYIPALFILDGKGRVMDSWEGYQPLEKLEPMVKKAIRGR